MSEPSEAALAAIPGVDSVELRGDTVYLQARDTDAIARHLLNNTDAHDLEITSRNLEQAFLTLTADDAGSQR
jgi:ABC-2 type transport system ATP-binding protein